MRAPQEIRDKVAQMARHLRRVETPYLTVREKIVAIRSHIRGFARLLMQEKERCR